MSLAILVPMVVVGVSLVIAAIHFSGLSHRTRIGDEAAVRARFALDYPLDTVVSVEPTADRRAAFLALDDGAVGIVECFGDRYVTERVTARDLARIERNGAGLALKSRDVTWSGGAYEFNGEAAAARIAGLLGGNAAMQPVKENA